MFHFSGSIEVKNENEENSLLSEMCEDAADTSDEDSDDEENQNQTMRYPGDIKDFANIPSDKTKEAVELCMSQIRSLRKEKHYLQNKVFRQQRRIIAIKSNERINWGSVKVRTCMHVASPFNNRNS